MPQLLGVIQGITQRSIEASAPTDMTVGTVTSTAPLQITTDISMQPLQAPVLRLTAAVIPKVLTQQPHRHEAGVAIGESAAPMVCIENGVALPSDNKTITLNRGLVVGDRVLLLRVRHGQEFIVLSRIY